MEELAQNSRHRNSHARGLKELRNFKSTLISLNSRSTHRLQNTRLIDVRMEARKEEREEVVRIQ